MTTLTNGLLADVTHALKRMLHRPAFTLISGVTLGLALGANVLAFAVLYGYLFRPLPYAAAGRLLVPRQRLVKAGLLGPQVSVHLYRTLKQLPAFRDAGLIDMDSGTVTVHNRHEFAEFTDLTPSTFTLLGVKPLLGRTLSSASDLPYGPHEVVVSYAFWQAAFGGKSDVLGRTLEVRGTPMHIVGVMPRQFVFPIPHTAFWMPFVITPALAHDNRINYLMLAHAPSGWSLSNINTLLGTIRDRELRSESPSAQARAEKNGYVIDAVPYRQLLLSYVGGTAPFWGLFAFSLLLLLLATLNSTTLVLARQRERLGDLKLRQVLGAEHTAIVRITLLEYLPALLLMGLIAAALAAYCIALLHAYQLPSPYMPFEIRFGPTAIIYLILVAVIVMLCITGSVVAASRLRDLSAATVQELAQRGTASRTFRDAQRAMAAIQIAIALILLVCGALLSQSLLALLNQPLHFRPQHLTVASVMLPQTTTVAEFWTQAHTVFRNLPGTQSAALSGMVPFGERTDGGIFSPASNLAKRTWAWLPMISSGFFETMGIRLLAGRQFRPTNAQSDSQHNVIVSEALARAFFGKTNVVGDTLDGNLRIIGVAPTLPWQLDPTSDHHGYTVYFPITSDRAHYVQLLIRTSAAPAVLLPAIRRAVAASAPDAVINTMHTLPQLMQQASLNRRAFTWLVVGLGALAFFMAVFGAYTIVAYGARLRVFEFAIRQVFGASRGRILTLTLRETAVLLLAGGAGGIAIAYVIAQGLHSLLYGVGALAPTLYLGSLVLIATAVFVAAALPVWYATRLNPAELMRR